MGVDGVYNVYVDIPRATAQVRYDDERTSVEEMAAALERGGHPMAGEPKYLK
jgi:copper chaperone CopZ